MNKIIFIAMFFISVSGCFIFSCYAEEAVALEDSGEENLLHESFDGRNWEVGWQKHDEQQSIIEYVLGGETVYNWSELVTVSIMIGLQETVTPEQFMENMKQNMKSSVQWNVLEKGDNDILYEWKVMGDPDLDDQHEIARITSTKEGMYSMRYTTKKVPISPDRREEWIKILGSGGFSADTQGSENEIFNKGMDYAEKGMYDEAITELTKVIQGNSRNVGAYYNRGVAYTMKGDTDRAISDYSKAIEIDPSDAELYYSRGLARAVKGDLDQAISDHNKAIQLNPKYAEAYANRGIAYYSKGDLDGAISDYNKAIEIDPNYASAYSNRGSVYKKKGDTDRAISDYSKAIEINPNIAEIYHNRGLVYYNKGDIDEAIPDFNKAIEINPNDVVFYDSRAFAYYGKGDYDKAWDDVHKMEALGRKTPPDFLEGLKRASGKE